MRVSKMTLAQSLPGLGVRLAAVAVMCAGLPACGGLGKALGLEKSSPDEFAIVTKAPLVIPPEFALRPPKPGAPRPQEVDASQVAEAALLGDKASGHTTSTRGETLLLSEAGALDASNAIREVLDAETAKVDHTDEADRSFFDHIFFWRGPEESADTVASAENAEKEVAKETAEDNAARERRKGWF